jgi:hypothetical protein
LHQVAANKAHHIAVAQAAQKPARGLPRASLVKLLSSSQNISAIMNIQ